VHLGVSVSFGMEQQKESQMMVVEEAQAGLEAQAGDLEVHLCNS